MSDLSADAESHAWLHFLQAEQFTVPYSGAFTVPYAVLPALLLCQLQIRMIICPYLSEITLYPAFKSVRYGFSFQKRPVWLFSECLPSHSDPH